MKGVILAGGFGTRLKPLTDKVPKPMIPIGDSPVMSYALHLLKRAQVDQVAVTLYYMPEKIMEHFGDGRDHDMNIRYYIEPSPLGTAGSVKQAQDFLDETFVVVSGDGLTDFDLQQALDFHRSKGAMATMVLTEVEDPTPFGIVRLNNRKRIVKFLEKPQEKEIFSKVVNTGIYIMEPEVFDMIPDNQPFDFSRHLFPLLMKKRKPLFGISLDGYWSDIGTMEQLMAAQRDMQRGLINIGGASPRARRVPHQPVASDSWTSSYPVSSY